MPDGWSRPLDAEQLADRRTDIDFSIPLRELPRIAPLLARDDGAAKGTVSFDRERALAVADLAVEAKVALTCQRCLRPMTWPIVSRARVAIVGDAAAADGVAPDLETVIAPGGQVSVGELVEEELLLGLPIVALHADGEACGERIDDEPDEVTQKPFAGLAELLKRSP
ncbi:MAG: DUF177 domain-containing protein [Steroidobacteraceae bacterium]